MYKSSINFLSIIFFSSVLILGCASHRGMVMLRNMDRPLQAIQKLVSQSFPEGPKRVLRKGRLFVSKPFIVRNGVPVPAGEAQHRYYVRVFIRGGQRPYTIDVEGVEEKFAGQGFRVVGRSEWIAKGMARVIYEKLTKRREQMNIIDDFRPF